MKDYSGSCEMCGADLSGGPETELAALRAQLAEAEAKIARLRAALEHYVDAETVVSVSWGYQETADDGAVAREALAVSLPENAPPAPAATASPTALRVIGQRDLTNGSAHLWIDHRAHTWREVVAGAVVTPVSGTVRVALGRPGAAYIAQWYDTRTRLATTRQTLTADAAGVVTLTVTNLATDTAVRLQRAAPSDAEALAHDDPRRAVVEQAAAAQPPAPATPPGGEE